MHAKPQVTTANHDFAETVWVGLRQGVWWCCYNVGVNWWCCNNFVKHFFKGSSANFYAYSSLGGNTSTIQSVFNRRKFHCFRFCTSGNSK